jgi:hypothetical protein
MERSDASTYAILWQEFTSTVEKEGAHATFSLKLGPRSVGCMIFLVYLYTKPKVLKYKG